MGITFRGALIDLDGTVFFKSAAIPGAREAIDRLRAAGLQLRFLSNTDSITSASLAARVTTMGIPLTDDEVFTAASAALEFLKVNGGKRCLCLLSDELADAFRDFLPDGTGAADYVIVGDCRHCVRYDVLNRAFQELMRGAQLVALQKGRYFVRENGYNLDTGAFVAMLEYASGTVAKVLGKPSREFFLGAVAQMRLSPKEVVIIGDDLETDIRGAVGVNMASILVRTGKYTQDAAPNSEVRPTWTVNSLADVPGLLLRDDLRTPFPG